MKQYYHLLTFVCRPACSADILGAGYEQISEFYTIISFLPVPQCLAGSFTVALTSHTVQFNFHFAHVHFHTALLNSAAPTILVA